MNATRSVASIPPVIILGVPGAGVSRLAAMIGCHPQMASLPELALGVSTRLEDFVHIDVMSADGLADGLLRAVALYFGGGEDDAAIAWARAWLERRASWSLHDLMTAFAQQMAPVGMAVAAATTGWRTIWLQRLLAAIPEARFVHLLQHPIPQCTMLARRLREAGFVAPDYKDYGPADWPRIDPQLAWYRINGNVDDALAALPAERVWRLHLEDVEAQPEDQIECLLRHLGMDNDAAALRAVLHPERSPFAVPGPPAARGGSDAEFLADPRLHRRLRPRLSLHDGITWRDDRVQLADEVVSLARRLGYR